MDGPLRPEDYRSMFAVLEDVSAATDLDAFRGLAAESLARRLGWRGVTVLAGSTAEATKDTRPGTDYFGRAYVDEYVERWWSVDPLASARGIRVMRTRGLVVLRDLVVTGDETEQAFADGFLRRHGIEDIVGTLIDVGSAGVGYLGVPRPENQPVSQRGLAILHKLRRQLAVYLEKHLSNARDRASDHGLTRREREVAELIARGYTNEQVARQLHIGIDTVKKHVGQVLGKTGCASRTQFVVFWLTQPR
jgi:DNA-binding CsgD family transcriptional regulator